MSNIDLAIAVSNLRDANNKIEKLSYELSLLRTSHDVVVGHLQMVETVNNALRDTISNNSETFIRITKLLDEARTQVVVLQDEKAELQEVVDTANALLNKTKPTKKGTKRV